MKKNNKKVTAIAAGIAMVALTAASLGTATYAWFTRGTGAQATGFNFTASAASGIQISTDTVNWKSSIGSDDYTTALLGEGGVQAGNRININGMEPISTDTTLSNGAYNFYHAVSGDGNFDVDVDTANYLVFDIYFKNDGHDPLTLRLTSGSHVLDGETDKDTALATRVSFVTEGSDSVANIANVVLSHAGSNQYVWEPNSLTRSSSATAKGATSNAKYTYYGMNAEGTYTTIDHYGTIAKQATTGNALVNSTKDLAIGDTDVLTVLPAEGQVTKVKIFVWVEGQDIDCNNGTSAGDVNISLDFDSASTAGTSASEVAENAVSAIYNNIATIPAGSTTLGATYTVYVVSTSADGHTADFSVSTLIATGSAPVTNVANALSITLSATPGTGAFTVISNGTMTGAVSSHWSGSIGATIGE